MLFANFSKDTFSELSADSASTLVKRDAIRGETVWLTLMIFDVLRISEMVRDTLDGRILEATSTAEATALAALDRGF